MQQHTIQTNIIVREVQVRQTARKLGSAASELQRALRRHCVARQRLAQRARAGVANPIVGEQQRLQRGIGGERVRQELAATFAQRARREVEHGQRAIGSLAADAAQSGRQRGRALGADRIAAKHKLGEV